MATLLQGFTIATVTVVIGVVVIVYAKFHLVYYSQRVVAYGLFALIYLRGTVEYFYPFAEVNQVRIALAVLLLFVFWFCDRLPLPAGSSRVVETQPVKPGMQANRRQKQEMKGSDKGSNFGGLTPGYVYGESKGSLWKM